MPDEEVKVEPRVCERHPDQAAVAACVHCGCLLCGTCRQLDEDGLASCPTCNARLQGQPTPAFDLERAMSAMAFPPPEDPPAPDPAPRLEAMAQVNDSVSVGEQLIPWEQPERYGSLMAFLYTVRFALFAPLRYMQHIPWSKADTRTPFLFAILAMTLGEIAGAAQMLFNPELAEKLLAQTGAHDLPSLLIILPAFPLLTTIGLFTFAGLSHGVLRMAGVATRDFEATFRIYAYAQAAALLNFVPFLGPMVSHFYLVFLVLGGIRTAHRASFGASLLALLPVILLRGLLGQLAL